MPFRLRPGIPGASGCSCCSWFSRWRVIVRPGGPLICRNRPYPPPPFPSPNRPAFSRPPNRRFPRWNPPALPTKARQPARPPPTPLPACPSPWKRWPRLSSRRRCLPMPCSMSCRYHLPPRGSTRSARWSGRKRSPPAPPALLPAARPMPAAASEPPATMEWNGPGPCHDFFRRGIRSFSPATLSGGGPASRSGGQSFAAGRDFR